MKETFTRQEVLDIVSFTILAADHCNIDDDVYAVNKKTITHMQKYWEEYKNSRCVEHYGDCVSEATPCLRCHINRADIDSSRIVRYFDYELEKEDE